MKICCLSDTHGYLPRIPECDILLLAGDYSPIDYGRSYYTQWYLNDFILWLQHCKEKCKYIVGIAGNHDFIFDENSFKYGIPSELYAVKHTINENWHYLENSSINIDGINICGIPHQRRFYDWAFNLDESELDKIFEKIPKNTDIILTHGPPLNILDYSPFGNENIGSATLRQIALDIQAKMVVFGHNHQTGIQIVENTTFVNAAYVDNQYNPYGLPIICGELSEKGFVCKNRQYI